MSEKDKSLVKQAMCCRDWNEASNLEKLAESGKAKQTIHEITVQLYRREEWYAGML